MQISNDPNVWVIYGLIFLLGLLLGLFLTAGGRKKWKTRYYDEVDRRKQLETDHAEAERDWRERDTLRDAAARNPGFIDRDRDGVDDRDQRATGRVDRDRDGIDDRAERAPGRVDRDRDGLDDRRDGYVDRDGDGVDDRRER